MEVCALLEARGVTCWLAPRDVAPGAKWDEAIVDAIHDATAFLLVLTHSANGSSYVSNEVNQAFGADKPIFTFRVEDVQPNKSLGFYLGRHHWTDGFPRPLDDKVGHLAAAVAAIASGAEARPSSRPAVQAPAPVNVHRAPPTSHARRVSWRAAAVAAACLLVGAAAPSAYLTLRAPAATLAPVVRFHVQPPDNLIFAMPGGAASVGWFSISPDGTKLVFGATSNGGRGAGTLWLRPIDRDVATMLPGTDNAGFPTWSPDGKAIAFLSQGKLKRIDLASGEVLTLADAGVPGGIGGNYFGFAWGSKRQILYSYARGNERPELFQVADTGGTVAALPKEPPSGRASTWPTFLPDGDHFLYLLASRTSGRSAFAIGSLSSKDHVELEPAESNAVFAGGHLLFSRQGTVVAQPFDPDRLRTMGDPVPIAQQVQDDPNALGAAFTASQTGVFVYHTGSATATQKLVWVDRGGAEQATAAPPNSYYGPRISPDGHRVAISIGQVPATQVWFYDLDRGTLSRLTFDGAANIGALWTPDGSRLVYKGTANNIFWQPADGSGAAEALIKTPPSRNNVASSLTPDGQTLLFTYDGPAQRNIWTLSMKDRAAKVWVKSDAYETAPRFSPDGRWIAYDSRESGHDEIYVRPYPGPGGKWQVSTQGGSEVVWNPNGRELFYREGTAMMAVDVATQPTFKAGNPHKLFDGPYVLSPLSNANYDVSSDGKRFLMLKPETGTLSMQLNVVVNWADELKRLAPAK